MKRRRFNKRERIALWLAADGKSELSGEPLGNDWHADHIVPWSKGGRTDVLNGQAITKAENLQKGNAMKFERLRKWQEDFHQTWTRSSNQDFMLAALPAAGKTFASLRVAKDFLQDYENTRLIVVVPTINVRDKWRDDGKKFCQIELQTKEFNGCLKSDFQGVVTTYHSIHNNSLNYRRLCNKHRCLVVLDEIHHVGDQSAWGKSIQEALEPATRRLCLSGTPFKSDGQKIPFLKINEDGFYHIDFRYDYPDALRDGVIREIVFHRFSGETELELNRGIVKFHTDDPLNEDDQSRRLRGLLQGEEFTKGILRSAHQTLLNIRRSKYDAGALAICIDINHAFEIKRLLREITGEDPAIVVSDNDSSNTTIDEFKESRRKWIVAVKMVSEGVDIPRLMVLAYLTNTTTDLFFRQAVGRIMRNQGTEEDAEAYCYIPDDERLSGYATKIEEFQLQVLKEKEIVCGPGGPGGGSGVFSVLSTSEAEYAGIIGRGSEYERDVSLEIKQLSDKFHVPLMSMAAIVDHFKSGSSVSTADVEPEEETPLEPRLDKLRKKCAEEANKLDKKWGVPWGDVNKRYWKICPISHTWMDESQLKAKLAWLEKNLNSL